MANFTETRIEQLTAEINNVSAKINAGDIHKSEYEKARMTINSLAIEAAVGGVLKSVKKDTELKLCLNKKKPTQQQIATIVGLIEDFCYGVESAYMAQTCNPDITNDDLSIPDVSGNGNSMIVSPEKPKHKDLEEIIFGSDGILYRPLTGREIIDLAAIAEVYRKRRNTVLGIAIGVGGALVIAGTAITIGVIAANKKKHEAEEADLVEGEIAENDIPDEISDEDIPEEIDAPEVSID